MTTDAVYSDPDNKTDLWINSQKMLEDTLAALSASVIALDTEFVRTNTYFPRPGLIQLFAGQQVMLIDPQEITDWAPLSRLFADSSVLKVVHACGEDLELFYCLGIDQPRPLFDTQVASALLGEELSEGLQKLAARVLDLHLPKHATRSDWTRRPLTAEQIHYARQDVIILLPIWQRLQQQLADQGKADLVLNEGDLMTKQAASPISDERAYLKLRGGWKLKPDAQYLLSHLAAWREATARTENRPRRFICTDDDLVQVADKQPVSLGQLTQCSGIQGSALRNYGKQIIDIVLDKQGQLNDPDGFDVIRPPLPRGAKELYQSVRNKAHKIAVASAIQPTLLASRTMLEALLYWCLNDRQPETPLIMTGWRRECVGETLVAFIEQLPPSSDPVEKRP